MVKFALFGLLIASLGLFAFFGQADAQVVKMKGIATTSPVRKDKVVLPDAEWKKKLTQEQYDILRAHGTEPAFCGVNLDQKGTGVYYCVGCKLPLFRAIHKFDSGTGWPSFYDPYSTDNVWFRTDRAFGMVRTEVLCSRCDGHLGHVFPDGPKPSGLRYCINGKVLQFVPDKNGEEQPLED